MKLIHLSDLHLGKIVNGFSMIEDQEYILKQIMEIIDLEKPEAVIIAGDVYDKSVPPAEAVSLFDSFLCDLAARKLRVFVISGNHDSPERIAFGNKIMNEGGVYMSPVYCGDIAPVTMHDDYGPVNIYMLPFVKPVHVRRFAPEEDKGRLTSYQEAVSYAVQHFEVDTKLRNILVTHQFVTGASRTDSELISVGGTDNVDASVFDEFDYVALGHIHRPQKCTRDEIRYCGTPLKYSFSEANDKKSVCVVNLCEKGSVEIAQIALKPLRDMAEIKGTYEELSAREFYENTSYREDYMHITLTDEEDVPEAIGRLRTIYHNLMKLDYDNLRTRTRQIQKAGESIESKTPLELFEEFYEGQNNQPMDVRQRMLVSQMMEKVWEE